jgi:flagellar basal body-associated protein FliL
MIHTKENNETPKKKFPLWLLLIILLILLIIGFLIFYSCLQKNQPKIHSFGYKFY